MSDAPLMIGVSGLRGIVGESLTPEVATNYSAAFGAWLIERFGWDEELGGPRVVVASDGRSNGPVVYEAVIEGLLASGCEVRAAGIQMTPSVGCAIHNDLSGEAGVVVTASHNPQQWNGIKLLVDGAAPPASVAEDIIMRFRSNLATRAERRGRREEFSDVLELHWVEVLDQVHWTLGHVVEDPQRDRPLLGDGEPAWRVVVDSVNSSGRAIVPEFFQNAVNVELHHLFADESGIFPHTPEPTEENLSGEGGLCDAVRELKSDVGFAQDPDGDRLAIVDENGKYIGEEYTLVLCAMSILQARQHENDNPRVHPDMPERGPVYSFGGPDADTVLCTNLSTSRMIDDVADKYGARVVRTAVGEANVVEAMKGLKREGKEVVLGGEGNGGVIWPKVTYVRDSLGSMALVLSLMARTGKTVSELVADVPSYAIVKRKQPLAMKEEAEPTIERLAEHYKAERVDRQDGVRIDFDSSKAWVHVRASNTEPILRLIAEAPSAEAAEALLDEVQKLVDAG